jgi:multiple sugar transport system substrate-binding protein
MKQLIFSCFILLTIASCHKQVGEQTDFVFWSSNNSEEIQFTRQYIDQWNDQFPESPFSFQPVPEGQSSEEVILAAVVGKTTPDVYANMWQGDVEDFAQSHVLIPLDTLDGFLEFLYQRCDSQVVREITSSDGHIYQVPWKVNPIMLMYNPDMFLQAGITEIPTDYSSFLHAGEQLKQQKKWLGISEVNAIWWQMFFNFLPHYYAASGGAPLVQNYKAMFDNKHGIAVFDFLQKVYQRGYFPREQMKGQSDPFLSGRVASTFTGPWTMEYNDRFKPKDMVYGFQKVLVPDGMTGPVYTYGDPKNIVIFNTCRNPELVWRFLQTMLTAEADKEFLALSGQIPRRKDLESNPLFVEYLEAHPKLLPFARQAKYVRGIDSAPYMKEVLDIIAQEYEACVVYGLKSPTEAINTAAKAVDLLYIHL